MPRNDDAEPVHAASATARLLDDLQLHGYRRGEVVPTLELLFSHEHPEDRPKCEEIVAQVVRTGGYFCMYHRIIDAQQVLNVKSMYAAILAAGALGYALNVLFLLIERRIIHWNGR